MRILLTIMFVVLINSALAQQKPPTPDNGVEGLWKKLQARVDEIDQRFDGAMGVTILDLTDGRLLTHNADQVFPTASSIKIAILLELYRQDQEAQTGAPARAKLTDLYTFD